jgi:hypothetical protein
MIATTTRAFIAAFAVAALISSQATAATLFDSLGFEDPPYLEGTIEGQNGWLAQMGNIGTADVQTVTVKSGSQAVRVDRVAGGDDRWGADLAGFQFPSERYVCVEWDMWVAETISADFGPFFGVEAFDDNGPTIRLGMFGVDATTGDVLYGDTATGLTETGSTVGFGAWNHFVMEFDFADHDYTVALNGTALLTTAFETMTDGLTDVDMSALAASLTGGDLTGTAYFDNFIVTETNITCIPEPGSWMLLVCGSAALLAIRRRSAVA